MPVTHSAHPEHNSLVPKPGMKDQRFEFLRYEVESSKERQARQVKGLRESMATFFVATNVGRDQAEASNSQPRRSGSRSNGEQNTTPAAESKEAYLPNMVELDISKFNGNEDPTSWICRADQFFKFHQTPEEQRVPLEGATCFLQF